MYSCLDSRILKESLTNLFKLLYKNNLKVTEKKSLTLGSITLYNYIKKYNQIKLDLPAKHKTLIRNAYFGGRCEVFGNVRSGEKVLHFDFSGMYQQCMLESLPSDSYTLSNENLSVDRPGFYFIEVETRGWLPVLPVRDFRLLFKCGSISGWFWHEEIQTALNHTECKGFKIKAGLVATKCEPILAEYINSLSLIKNQKGLRSKIGKHLINSLYGRFAIKDEVERSEIVNTVAGLQQYIPIQGAYSIENTTVRRKKKSNIGVAAAIASKGRKKLYEGFLEVQKAGGRILYCDTDSIYAAFPYKSSVEGKLLGQHVTFGLDERKIADAVFIAPKMYAVLYEDGVEVIKLKGINNKHTFEDIKHFFYSENDNHVLDYTIIDKNSKNEYVYENKRLQKTPYHKRL